MTVRRVAAEVALIVSVVIVATATGAVLGLRAFDRWMSAPARPNRTPLHLANNRETQS